MSELVTRIPAEEMTTCKAWSLPEVQSNNTVSAIKKESNFSRRNRERSIANKKNKDLNTGSNKQTQEIVEDVVLDPTSGDPISANELKSVADEVEKLGREDGYKKGYKKGYEEGYQIGLKKSEEEGLKQGLEKAEEQIHAQVEDQNRRLEAIAKALLNPLEHEQEQLEKQLLGMVSQLTEAVIKRELMTDSSMVLSVIQETLLLLTNKEKNVTLYLNSQDIPVVKESLSESDLSISCEADDTLSVGGCRVDNQLTIIDASIEKQLENLLEGFVNKQYPPIDSISQENTPKENVPQDYSHNLSEETESEKEEFIASSEAPSNEKLPPESSTEESEIPD